MITDFETWYRDVGCDRLFRFLVYRRMFTPYELDAKFVDETEYEDISYDFGRIEEAIDLGNGDWLLGIRNVYPDEDLTESDTVSYYRLSEIRLAFREKDETDGAFAWDDNEPEE